MKISRRTSVFCILVVALAVRLFRLGDPLGGFHGFNEAWYAAVAGNYSGGSLLLPTAYTGAPDFNIPPLFSWTLYAFISLFGSGEFVMRLPSVIASLAFVYFMMRVTEELFGRRAGLAAGLMAAVMPVSVVLGRNCQVDMTAAAFMMAFCYFALKSDGGLWGDLKAGLFFGLAVFTKQPAALVIIPVVLYHPGSDGIWKYIIKRLPRMLLIAVVVAAPFYLYQMAAGSGGAFAAKQRGLMASMEVPDAQALLFLLRETYRGMSVPLFALGLAGACAAVIRRGREYVIPSVTAAVFSLFFAFFHHHTYYMFFIALGLIPLAASLFAGAGQRTLKNGMLIATCAWALLASVIMLTVVKFGWQAFAEMNREFDERGISAPVVITTTRVIQNFGPLIYYYSGGSRVLDIDKLPLREDGAVNVDYMRGMAFVSYEHSPFAIPGGDEFTLKSNIEALYLFGVRIYGKFPGGSANPHCFSRFIPVAERTESFSTFGFRTEAQVPIIRVDYFAKNNRLIKEKGQLIITVE